MARHSGSKKGFGRERYSVIVDGDTEIWYLQMMRRNENLPIKIEPELSKKKSLLEQYRLVEDNVQIYDKVFWIIDLDAILLEDLQHVRGEKPSESLKRCISKANANKAIHILINNPCLEFWFLLHFEFSSKIFTKCIDAEKALKRHIPTYQKTQGFFTKEHKDIYLQLKPNLGIAIENAAKLGTYDHGLGAKAEIYKLFEMFLHEKI